MEEHLGRTVPEMVPDLFPSVEPYIRRALGGEAITGVEVTKRDPRTGETKNLLQSYERAMKWKWVGVSVALMEVTQMRRAEEAQREAEAHFRHMIEAMPQIPWIIDPEGRALDVSQRWLELTGTAAGEWRGFGWLESSTWMTGKRQWMPYGAPWRADTRSTWCTVCGNRSAIPGNEYSLVVRPVTARMER